jgi:TetR/AcrR family transcriptional repressor of mexJK operon
MAIGKQELSPRAQSKQAQIRDGARRVFLANGFAGTGTDAITAEAGVSKQTLYVYYRTKEDLFVAVLRAIVGELPDVHATITADGLDSPTALRACLMSLSRDLVALLMQPDYIAFMRLVFAEIPRMPQLGELWQRALPAQVIRATAGLLEAARANGVVRFTDPEAAVRLLVGPLVTFVVLDGLATAGPPRRPSDRAIRQIVDLFLVAIANPANEGAA